MIQVVLHGELRQWSPGGRKQLSVAAAGRRASEVVRDMGIPSAETAAFIVNGEQTDGDVVLAAGDTLEILPAISGGADAPAALAKGGPVPPGALDGVRVLDLTRALAGPYCTLMLGDHGADVIKVELPGTGDETREWMPPAIGGISAYYLAINRNKRSVTVDLKHPEGKRVLERLIERSDVMVENFSPGTLARLGFPDERVRGINRRAIVCHVSGFGQDGPGRAWPAYDLIVQGMGGIMSLTGEPGSEPVMVGVPQADMVAGMFAAFAVVAALHARERTGEGQIIDATMIGGQVAMLSRQAARYFADGTVPRPEGNIHASIVPYQTFRASDGHVNVGVANNALFERFCRAIDLEELLADPRFADNPSRVAHRKELVPVLERRIAQFTKAEVVRRLREANVPVGPINALDEVFADPVIRHLGLIAEVDHPTAGRVRAPGIPVRLSETPASVRRHPPLLGEHTDEVLAELGYTSQEIAGLRRGGAI
jgi:formyl-CoA transferase